MWGEIARSMSYKKRKISFEDFFEVVQRDCRAISGYKRPAEGEEAHQYDCRLEDFVRNPVYPTWFVNDTRTAFRSYYLEAQAHNLAELRRLPEFAFVERTLALYDRSFALRARDPDVRALQLFIVCDGALLSAAATIGRALPGDTIALTRRAIEAASLAAAIKADPANYERWLDEEKRLARWEERNEGRQPKGQPGCQVVYPPSVNTLRSYLGTLSDAGVHLTPEFISTQRYRVEPIEGTSGGYLRIIYFETEQRELERALMLLASIHLEILEAFDGVFDGVFHRDTEWMRQREEIGRFGRVLAERFKAEAESADEKDS